MTIIHQPVLSPLAFSDSDSVVPVWVAVGVAKAERLWGAHDEPGTVGTHGPHDGPSQRGKQPEGVSLAKRSNLRGLFVAIL